MPSAADPRCMATLRLLRHATLVLEVADRTLLVDPMLGAPGDIPPIPNSPNDRENPLVPLPDWDAAAVDAVVVTHTHRDHFDDTAADELDGDLPLFCQPEDAEEIREQGFTDVRPVETTASFGPVEFTRTDGRHGQGELADQMGPVSGFVLDAPEEPEVYVAGDTVWCDRFAAELETHDPDVVVLNTGGARFVEGPPITMTDDDVAPVCEACPQARLVAVHMDAINHCLQTRADLRAALDERGLADRVELPADGESLSL